MSGLSACVVNYDVPGHLLWRVGFIEIRRAPSIRSLPRLSRWSFSDVGRSAVPRVHSRYLGLVWLILPRNLEMCSVQKEENLNPKRSPEINTYVRAREAPWMSGFWTPAGFLPSGQNTFPSSSEESTKPNLNISSGAGAPPTEAHPKTTTDTVGAETQLYKPYSPKEMSGKLLRFWWEESPALRVTTGSERQTVNLVSARQLVEQERDLLHFLKK